MILIADGGSTKCDWAVVDNTIATIVKQFQTEGLNPFVRTEEDMLSLLKTEVAPQISTYNIDRVFFYGAGVTPEKSGYMASLLATIFATADITATSDMDGAARGTVADGDGIVAILGTGSNTTAYTSGKPTDKVEIGGIDGKPIEAIDLTKLSDDELQKLIAKRRNTD